ncbi:unnamed protein product [Periconia digitata]|uniref:Uncharacterized protein n=1 Tax=Periconia digitata TaxID=1303443 RepID=A0A9W4U8D1_9PLEO|nr:unnamed protein product [Periconia digitata]
MLPFRIFTLGFLALVSTVVALPLKSEKANEFVQRCEEPVLKLDGGKTVAVKEATTDDWVSAQSISCPW